MPKIIKAKGIYQSQFDVTDHEPILNDSDVKKPTSQGLFDRCGLIRLRDWYESMFRKKSNKSEYDLDNDFYRVYVKRGIKSDVMTNKTIPSVSQHTQTPDYCYVNETLV